MPRPTPAQYVTGTATTLLSVVVLLLLTSATGAAAALVAVLGLALGVLAAVTVARPERGRSTAAYEARAGGGSGTAGTRQTPSARSGPGGRGLLSGQPTRR